MFVDKGTNRSVIFSSTYTPKENPHLSRSQKGNLVGQALRGPLPHTPVRPEHASYLPVAGQAAHHTAVRMDDVLKQVELFHPHIFTW